MWTSSARALAELHATYIDAVNRAVTDGRDELVAELEQEYETQQMWSRRSASTRLKVPDDVEPPVGVEPTTYALRVRRSSRLS